ncbi:hypothetical protein G5714_016929 [Onychostoma macrolepis]|uniref:Phospholipase A2 n=1 Tax=Onychostoma macrolepis TaxID=369639 RepID=A0A7J6C4C0_9TELE|nr:hypothetical protein G5714_016929 [Onychostoma macrolepis]
MNGQKSSCCTGTCVTVLRGKFNQSYDLLSKCDCYVVLKFPTACACCHRTKTVKNSNAPKWNETFGFRVNSGVKNILEFHIFDADKFTKDDYFSTILFDINNLIPGQKQTKSFITDDKKKSELWVEFEMTVSSGKPEPYFSNGVLMFTPAEKDMMLKLRGAYKEDCLIPGSEENPSCTQTIHYYINRDLETEFSLIPPKAGEEVDRINPKIADILSSAPMKPLPAKQQIQLSMPIGKHYKEKMEEIEKEGLVISLTDMWGLAIEYLIQGKKEMGTLSDQQVALSKGQNPLPIYTALTMKNSKTGCTTETEWSEFTPYEFEFIKYGAFIPAQNFWSEYYLGHMIKKLPESRIYSLLGKRKAITMRGRHSVSELRLGPGPLQGHKANSGVLFFISFPKIDYKKLESEPIREVYVFEDKENPDVPIVIHFPLANVSFRQFKSPGVKREGKAEIKEGDFDIDFTSLSSPFSTLNFTYKPEDFQKLSNSPPTTF